MRLSELKTGESATIVKVMGHGGFRRRIMEMGFVRGQRVEVILNAPLKDPIEYKIMGYDISLRRSEADMVVVLIIVLHIVGERVSVHLVYGLCYLHAIYFFRIVNEVALIVG